MDALTARRLDWIRELETGDRNQTTGLLCQIRKNVPSYCCLGVARDVETPGYFQGEDFKYSFNEEMDYDFVREYYEFDVKMMDHLIAMNDGSEIIGDYGVIRVGNHSAKRDFKFIARFLRKVWGLTNV